MPISTHPSGNYGKANNQSGSTSEAEPFPFQRASTGDCVVRIQAFETDDISPISGIRTVRENGTPSQQSIATNIAMANRAQPSLKGRACENGGKSLLLMTVLGFYVILGVVSLDKCPVNLWLPIWVVGTGMGLMLAIPILHWIHNYFAKAMWVASLDERCLEETNTISKNPCFIFRGVILVVFRIGFIMAVLVWWIMGSYLVASICGHVSFSSSDIGYCDPVLYIVTLEVIISLWIILFLVLIWIVDRFREDPRFLKVFRDVFLL